MGEKFKQALSANQVLCLALKKILAQGIAEQNKNACTD